MKAISSIDFTKIAPGQQSLSLWSNMWRKMYQNLTFIINGHIGFGDGTHADNIDGVWVNITTPAPANTNFTVVHNLGRIPVGYLVAKTDAAVQLYDGTIPATATTITWRDTGGSAHMRVFVFALLMALFAIRASAQTTVNLNVTGTDTQVWYNGSWKVHLKQAQGTSGGPPFNIISGGGLLNDQAGTLNPSGNATMSLPSNVNIAPANSVWQFTVCPDASFPCFVQELTIGTSSPQAVNLTPPPIVVSVLLVPPPVTAYADSEITGAVKGTIYYNTTSGLYRQCNAAFGGVCSSWAGLGGSTAWSAITGFPAACTPGTFVVNIQTGQCNPTLATLNFGGILSGTNTAAAMVVGTGASLATSGSGTIAATSVPFSGVGPGTNTSALVVGTGGSVSPTGTGVITATNSATGTVGNCVQFGTGLTFTSSGSPCSTATGTVTSFSAGNLSPLFNSSVATPTSTPALTFSAISQSANQFYASPNGSSGVPGFRAIASGDVPTGALPASTGNCTGGQVAVGFTSGGTMSCVTILSGIHQVQFLQITSGICTTPGSAETTCSMGPFSWGTAFSSSSYSITCTPTTITGSGTNPGIYSLRWTSKSTTQFSLTMQSGSASAAGTNTTSEIDCIGVQ